MNCAPLIHLIALHVGAYHSAVATPGVGVVCSAASVEVATGIYRNSNDKKSIYGVLGALPWSIGPLRVGAFVGTVDGYKWKHNGHFVPFGGLQAAWPTSFGTLRFQLVPHPARNCATVLGLAIQF